jgi:predicted RNase H-like nuclease (RuvC/YqgF family)
MYENEFEELTLNLKRAQENIQGLVRDNDALSQERNSLKAELIAAKAEAAEADRRANDTQIKSNWELMAKDKHISYLATEIKKAKGESIFSPSIPYRRDDS